MVLPADSLYSKVHYWHNPFAKNELMLCANTAVPTFATWLPKCTYLTMLKERIDVIGREIEAVISRLTELGYEFDDPEDAFPGVEEGTEEAIERIESEVGTLPLALKLFWRQIGSVNLLGAHHDWTGCEYPDPLVVYPPSAAIDELEEFLADREERIASGFPYVVPVSADYYHKADVSGGMWYNVSVPAVADDPPLNDEWRNVSFVTYLEISLAYGGFAGLSCSPDHTWPLAKLLGKNPV